MGRHKGYKHSEETKAKISLSKIGKKLPPFSEKWKRNLSIAHQGHLISEESRQRMSLSHKGKHHSKKAKYKMKMAIRTHHIDCIHSNNDEYNKIELTNSEHTKAHWSLNKLVKELLDRSIIRFNRDLKIYEVLQEKLKKRIADYEEDKIK